MNPPTPPPKKGQTYGTWPPPFQFRQDETSPTNLSLCLYASSSCCLSYVQDKEVAEILESLAARASCLSLESQLNAQRTQWGIDL